jgi:hypothetical protein
VVFQTGGPPSVAPPQNTPGGSMTETVTAYAYRAGEAVAPYILDAALTRLAGITLFIAGFGMLLVMAIMDDH